MDSDMEMLIISLPMQDDEFWFEGTGRDLSDARIFVIEIKPELFFLIGAKGSRS